MKILNNHLCYCFNVLEQNNSDPISPHFISLISKIRKKIALPKDQSFAIGLWINAEKLKQFFDKRKISLLRKILEENHLYVTTINAFPYADFHNKIIKENVYLPDWTNDERLQYSMKVAEFLSEILPPDITGSISTVPGGYQKFIRNGDLAKIAKNLSSMNKHLENILNKKRKKIILAIEFEPDCIWERAHQFVEFKTQYLKNQADFIGVCYDCAHAEVLKSNPIKDLNILKEANITIGKIQLTAALRAKMPEAKQELAKFADNTYLHQTFIYNKNNLILRVEDLIHIINRHKIKGDLLSHYHLPIFFESDETKSINAAKSILIQLMKLASLNKITNATLEIETYTYSVLPKNFQFDSVEDMISEEYKYAINIMIKSSPQMLLNISSSLSSSYKNKKTDV